jgi:hypothetical protein
LIKDDQLNREYAANKSVAVGRGTALSTGLGLSAMGFMGWLAQSVAQMSTFGMYEAGIGGAAMGIPTILHANRDRDWARGDTVRFALANGFKIDRKLVTTMKQAGGRYGAFDGKTVAAFKLKPEQQKKGGTR